MIKQVLAVVFLAGGACGRYRSFALGQDVDQSGARAKYADGILELPKKATAAARKLTVQ
jgi:HSP20 family molecular chaperone IbpA